MSRPALPRNEDGTISRPDGWVKPERKSKTVEHAPLSFTAGILTAGLAVFNGEKWEADGYTVEKVAAELAAAEKSMETLTALQAVQTLPNPNEFDPKAALKTYGFESPTFGAFVDYWRHTRSAK